MDAANDRERQVARPRRLFAVLVTAIIFIAAVVVLWMLLVSARHLAVGGAYVSVACAPGVLLTCGGTTLVHQFQPATKSYARALGGGYVEKK